MFPNIAAVFASFSVSSVLSLSGGKCVSGSRESRLLLVLCLLCVLLWACVCDVEGADVLTWGHRPSPRDDTDSLSHTHTHSTPFPQWSLLADLVFKCCCGPSRPKALFVLFYYPGAWSCHTHIHKHTCTHTFFRAQIAYKCKTGLAY